MGFGIYPNFQKMIPFVHENADNMIATAVAFAIIDDIVNSPKVFRDVDVTFIFTFVEEVFEISANHALLKEHALGKIDPETNILVLESMSPSRCTLMTSSSKQA